MGTKGSFLRGLERRGERPVHEGDHTVLSSVEGKNEWICTSTYTGTGETVT